MYGLSKINFVLFLSSLLKFLLADGLSFAMYLSISFNSCEKSGLLIILIFVEFRQNYLYHPKTHHFLSFQLYRYQCCF